jgi:hypothetical protein
MTDNTNATSRRPRGRKAAPAEKPSPRESRWNDDTQRWRKYSDASRWNGEIGVVNADKLSISQEVLDNYRREGIAFAWVTESCLGKEEPEFITAAQKSGGTLVEEGDFPTKDIPLVAVGGQRLMAFPTHAMDKLEAKQKRDAAVQMDTRLHKLKYGDLPMTGADHPSARRSNFARPDGQPFKVPVDGD